MLRSARLLTAGLAVVLAATGAQPLAAAAVSGSGSLQAVPTHDHGTHDHGTHGLGGAVPEDCRASSGGSVLCTHADAPPAGIDVTRLPSTRELRARRGAAHSAALGAQATALAVQAADSAVPCDGDGTSGPRVQAMYVVAADKPNRFAALEASLGQWAAGVDAVVSRSAAQSGGDRHVRFVTGPALSGACAPVVLNVTVPAGKNVSFNSTISAVRALGHTDPDRKYLMWVDAAALCGIATTFLDDRPGQGNTNNGLAPMYARIDSGCWGGTFSVEAHELLHNLGSVQRSAPNSTVRGHCRDDADRMCYSDGPGVVMRSVCPAEHEALLDCRNDDYFLAGTPPTGSYLATHWNTADSRFLLRDGAPGGAGTTPTGLRVVVAVANPAVPGLPVPVSVKTSDVPGRAATVAWRSSRRDCTFADPAAATTTVTCAATSATRTTVSATVGNAVTAPVVVSSPLTFTAASRTAAVTSAVDGTSGAGTVTACPKTALPVSASVVDAGTSGPVKGLKVQFVQLLAGRTTVLATVKTAADGTATGRVVGKDGAEVFARTVKGGAFASQVSASTSVSARPCATSVEVAVDTEAVALGGKVMATGSLRRTLGSDVRGVAGAAVSLVLVPTAGGTSKVLASGRTDAAGAFRLTGAPRTTGTLVVRYAGGATYVASASTPAPLRITA